MSSAKWWPFCFSLHVVNLIFHLDSIDGLVQDCSNSNALVMELLQSCTKPAIYLDKDTLEWYRIALQLYSASQEIYLLFTFSIIWFWSTSYITGLVVIQTPIIQSLQNKAQQNLVHILWDKL